MDDLESKSSSSSEGYHFEITEARKQRKNQEGNRNANETQTLPNFGIQDPGKVLGAMQPQSKLLSDHGSMANFLKLDSEADLNEKRL